MNNYLPMIVTCLSTILLAGCQPWPQFQQGDKALIDQPSQLTSYNQTQDEQGGLLTYDHPLSIEYMRQRAYPGSEIVIEQELANGSNYSQAIVSYRSEGLKIYALMTTPLGEPPANGWPVIVFNHGFIRPTEYRTTERYVAYVAGFARAGYIVFRSDYRGHGNSEGEARGGYGSPDYTVDILNAVSSLKRHPFVDARNMGIWGHSMGGPISLRAMVVDPDIKVGVMWAGVMGSYAELMEHWHRRRPDPAATPNPLASRGGSWRRELVLQYGEPTDNPEFWAAISPTSFVADLSGSIQLHHGTADESVPMILSELFEQKLRTAGKGGSFFSYPGDDLNLAQNFSLAMQRSVEFFDEHLK